MQSFEYVVKDELGLHARPAGLLVKFVSSCSSEINLTAHDKTASAKKLFGIMGLCVKMNDKITFTVIGPDEKADCAKIKEFCEKNI